MIVLKKTDSLLLGSRTVDNVLQLTTVYEFVTADINIVIVYL